MIKTILLISVLNLSVSNDYVMVHSISCYQDNDIEKKIMFEFESDYYSVHELNVEINLYDIKENWLVKYVNDIKVIGNKSATANFNFNNDSNFYALINIKYKGVLIVNNAKINFYIQESCNIDLENNFCNRVYKSEFKDGVSKDLYTDFNVRKDIFNKYLIYNNLNVEDISFYTNYDFKDSNVYLVIKDKLDDYNINYYNGYTFVLKLDNTTGYKFSLLDKYFVNLIEFKYSEEYFVNSLETTSIYFPYSSDYNEYHCMIVIEDFINITINFTVIVNGNIYGDCSDSKFCLVRSKG